MRISRRWLKRLQKLTIPEALVRVIAKRGRHAFMYYHEHEYSYEDFGDIVERWRDALWAHGFNERDRAGIFAENMPEWCASYLATIAAGGVAVPLELKMAREHLVRLLDKGNMRFVFTSEKYYDQVVEVLPELPHIEYVVLLDGEGPQHPGVIGREAFLAKRIHRSEPTIDIDDVCMILYTAGTTGDPKEVPLTHRNLISGVVMGLELTMSCRSDCLLNPLPLYHIFSLVDGFLAPLLGGMSMALTSRLDRGELKMAITTYPVTMLICVPAFYAVMSQQIKRKIKHMVGMSGWLMRWFARRQTIRRSPALLRRIKHFLGRLQLGVWRNVRLFISGGAALDLDVVHTFNAVGLSLMEGYGMTESSAAVVLNTPRHYRVGSVGRPDPRWLEVRIENPDDEGVGEVMLRSPMMMHGYEGRVDSELYTEDGFFKTGDMGFVDRDGYLYITGRRKDVIIPASGKNIYPQELEYHYSRSPLIKEICIFGLPEKGRKGEVAHAAVVVAEQLLAHGEDTAYEWLAAELHKLSRELPAYKRLKSFSIWRGDFPCVSTGKIKKFEVRDQIINHVGKGAEEPVVSVADELLMSHPEAHYICQLLMEMAPKRAPIFPNTQLLDDLGMDALLLAKLVVRLEEHYNRRLSVEGVQSVRTVKDAIVLIERSLHEDRSQRY